MDFPELYARYRNPVFQLALRLLKNEEAAVDATQEAFAKAYAARASFRGEALPSTWLYRIAYNLCVGRLEKRRSTVSLEGFDAPDAEGSRPEAAAARSERAGQVRSALGRLEEEDRRLLCLQMEEDLGYAELAGILDCSQEAVRMRVSRARRRLRELLEPLLGKDDE